MVPTLCVGTRSRTLCVPNRRSGSACIPTQSVGTMKANFGKLILTISLELYRTLTTTIDTSSAKELLPEKVCRSFAMVLMISCGFLVP
jgi:hypothetical protein